MTHKRLVSILFLRYRDRKNGILLEQAAENPSYKQLEPNKQLDSVLGLTTNTKRWRIGPLC